MDVSLFEYLYRTCSSLQILTRNSSEKAVGKSVKIIRPEDVEPAVLESSLFTGSYSLLTPTQCVRTKVNTLIMAGGGELFLECLGV